MNLPPKQSLVGQPLGRSQHDPAAQRQRLSARPPARPRLQLLTLTLGELNRNCNRRWQTTTPQHIECVRTLAQLCDRPGRVKKLIARGIWAHGDRRYVPGVGINHGDEERPAWRARVVRDRYVLVDKVPSKYLDIHVLAVPCLLVDRKSRSRYSHVTEQGHGLETAGLQDLARARSGIGADRSCRLKPSCVCPSGSQL